MDRYIRKKCVQSGCLPSLYTSKSDLKSLRHSLVAINIEIVKIDNVFITMDDQVDVEAKLVHIKCSDSQFIETICNSLSCMQLKFAQPWHQSWFNNVPVAYASLEILDIFDLISLQIDDHRLYATTNELIKSKLNLGSTRFDLNKYLFDNDRNTVSDEILLYFVYHYGRYHFSEIVWLEDFRGTEHFDACISELNIKLINLHCVELSLDNYEDVYKLVSRIWSSKHQFTIKMGSKFSGTVFQKLVQCDSVQEIYLDVGLGINYAELDGYQLEVDEFAGRSYEHKYIFIQSSTHLNEVDDCIKYFTKYCNCIKQKRYFYLTLDGVAPDNWTSLLGLNISEISFKNLEITKEKLMQLAGSTMATSNITFIDCTSLSNDMLLTFLRSSKWIKSLKIKGRSTITADFVKQYARMQIAQLDLDYYIFGEEELMIEIEGLDAFSGIFSRFSDEFVL